MKKERRRNQKQINDTTGRNNTNKQKKKKRFSGETTQKLCCPIRVPTHWWNTTRGATLTHFHWEFDLKCFSLETGAGLVAYKTNGWISGGQIKTCLSIFLEISSARLVRLLPLSFSLWAPAGCCSSALRNLCFDVRLQVSDCLWRLHAATCLSIISVDDYKSIHFYCLCATC